MSPALFDEVHLRQLDYSDIPKHHGRGEIAIKKALRAPPHRTLFILVDRG